MKKSKVYVVFMIFSCIFFASCIDVQEYVSASKKGIKINYRIALQKSLFAVANSDIDDVLPITFAQDDFESGINKDYVTNFGVEDSELERTLVIGLDAPAVRKESDLDGILPVKTGKGYKIPLLPLSGQTDIDSEGNAVAAAIFSSSKYRIVIDKSLIKNITAAVLHSQENTIPLSVINWDSIFVIEISMGVIFMLPKGSYIEIW